MRVLFLSLISIFFIAVISVVLVNSMTGSIVTTPGCQVGCTPAFYRTLDEKARVEAMWERAGFANMGTGPAPESFKSSGYLEFACMCPRPWQELGQEQFLPHPRVVTEGSTYSYQP
jgi:hypothetical protein